jgi:hypothetical protein
MHMARTDKEILWHNLERAIKGKLKSSEVITLTAKVSVLRQESEDGELRVWGEVKPHASEAQA